MVVCFREGALREMESTTIPHIETVARRTDRSLTMGKHFAKSFGVLASLLALCSLGFAQTYGTKGYAPGAWKPEELPPELSKPKPFNAHDLSGVWSMPTKGFEKHSLTSKPLALEHVPNEMTQTSVPPPMTAWGKARLRATKGGSGRWAL